jgi:hypothetical protein
LSRNSPFEKALFDRSLFGRGGSGKTTFYDLNTIPNFAWRHFRSERGQLQKCWFAVKNGNKRVQNLTADKPLSTGKREGNTEKKKYQLNR